MYKKNICFCGASLAPPFNESTKNHVRDLSVKLNATVITLDSIYRGRPDNYIIVKEKYPNRNYRVFKAVDILRFLFTIKKYEKRFDILHLIGSPIESYYKYLPLEKCVHSLLSSSFIDSVSNNIYLDRIATSIKAIIVESAKTQKDLIDHGIDKSKIKLILPGIDLSKFLYYEPYSLDEFRLIFASAPTSARLTNWYGKGINLMLEAYKEFSKDVKSKLYIVWRKGDYSTAIKNKICNMELESNVKIIEHNVVNITNLYKESHACIIPYINLNGSKDFPTSAIESLAIGRPVITTNVPEIWTIINREKCGVISNPEVEDFANALHKCKDEYSILQKSCRNAAEKYFNLEKEIRELGNVYNC